MNETETWIQQADNALRRAARRAREVAARTNTPIIVQKEGKIVQIAVPDHDSVVLRDDTTEYVMEAKQSQKATEQER